MKVSRNKVVKLANLARLSRTMPIEHQAKSPSPKQEKRRTGSNTENRNWEDNDEEGFSWNTAERQHEQLKMRRKNRNSKTFLRKVKIVSKSSSGSFDGEGNRFITNESL